MLWRVVVVLWGVVRFQRGEEEEVLNVSEASESSRRREELSGEQEEEGRRLKVLLVEDEEAHAIILKRMLQKSRLKTQIYEVRDGESALNFLFNRGEYADKEKYPRPDVVLLDLRLPKVDGTEVLRQIKESRELRDLPVVVLTSSDRDEDIIKTYENGASGYILKTSFIRKSPRMDSLLDIILSIV
ncbi:MAG: CheY-like REC domain [Methanophagales archaeon]|nr:response regulator [Methanophagales archaeon]MCU4140664.1 CheY-like REC domain [Methanophagales archaeon]